MTATFATLIVGQGDSSVSTSLTKELYDDYLKNGMEYDETDPSTGKLNRFHIMFLPFFVFSNNHPPCPCTPAPVFIVRGRAPFLYQACISNQLP